MNAYVATSFIAQVFVLIWKASALTDPKELQEILDGTQPSEVPYDNLDTFDGQIANARDLQTLKEQIDAMNMLGVDSSVFDSDERPQRQRLDYQLRNKRPFCNGFYGCGRLNKRLQSLKEERLRQSEPLEEARGKRPFCNGFFGCRNGKRSFSAGLQTPYFGSDDSSGSDDGSVGQHVELVNNGNIIAPGQITYIGLPLDYTSSGNVLKEVLGDVPKVGQGREMARSTSKADSNQDIVEQQNVADGYLGMGNRARSRLFLSGSDRSPSIGIDKGSFLSRRGGSYDFSSVTSTIDYAEHSPNSEFDHGYYRIAMKNDKDRALTGRISFPRKLKGSDKRYWKSGNKRKYETEKRAMFLPKYKRVSDYGKREDENLLDRSFTSKYNRPEKHISNTYAENKFPIQRRGIEKTEEQYQKSRGGYSLPVKSSFLNKYPITRKGFPSKYERLAKQSGKLGSESGFLEDRRVMLLPQNAKHSENSLWTEDQNVNQNRLHSLERPSILDPKFDTINIAVRVPLKDTLPMKRFHDIVKRGVSSSKINRYGPSILRKDKPNSDSLDGGLSFEENSERNGDNDGNKASAKRFCNWRRGCRGKKDVLQDQGDGGSVEDVPGIDEKEFQDDLKIEGGQKPVCSGIDCDDGYHEQSLEITDDEFRSLNNDINSILDEYNKSPRDTMIASKESETKRFCNSRFGCRGLHRRKKEDERTSQQVKLKTLEDVFEGNSILKTEGSETEEKVQPKRFCSRFGCGSRSKKQNINENQLESNQKGQKSFPRSTLLKLMMSRRFCSSRFGCTGFRRQRQDNVKRFCGRYGCKGFRALKSRSETMESKDTVKRFCGRYGCKGFRALSSRSENMDSKDDIKRFCGKYGCKGFRALKSRSEKMDSKDSVKRFCSRYGCKGFRALRSRSENTNLGDNAKRFCGRYGCKGFRALRSRSENMDFKNSVKRFCGRYGCKGFHALRSRSENVDSRNSDLYAIACQDGTMNCERYDVSSLDFLLKLKDSDTTNSFHICKGLKCVPFQRI